MRIALVGFSENTDDVSSLADELTRQGHQVERHTPTLAAADAADQLGEHVQQLGQVLRDSDCELVHSHGWLAGLATQLAERPAGVRAVHTFHQLQLVDELTLPGGPRATTRSRAERAIALKADHVLATSMTERDVLIQVGVRRDRVSVVPPAVCPDLAASTSAHTRERVAAFGPAERVAAAVHALTTLPGTTLVLAGEAAEVGHRERLLKLAERMRVRDRVTVPGPDIDQLELIRSVDAVVYLAGSAATRDEHLLAMTVGTPLIACTRTSAEAVVEDATGLYLPDPTPAELAKQLRRLWENDSLRMGMAIAARDRVLSRYSWERIGEETARAYQQLLVHETVQQPAAANPTTPEVRV